MIRTGYSFKTAVGHLPDVMQRLKEIEMPAAPICDRMSTFGFVRWTSLCKKNGMKPVYGVEIGVVPEFGANKPATDFWRFIAKDKIVDLHSLIATATVSPGKYPSLSYAQAMKAKGVFKIIGERSMIEQLKPAPDLVVGLSPATTKGGFNAAKDKGFKFVSISDNFYPTIEDEEFYRITIGREANAQTYPRHILSDEEWIKAIEWQTNGNIKIANAAIKERDKLLAASCAELQKAELLVPEKKKTLKQMCIDGAKRTGVNLKDKVYKERLERELKLIDSKNFDDYFYIIADLINWAKERMIVGPARGSSCGSLVCYLLNITTIDPIPFGLIFERFIDINRTDLPDIDIDFSDKRREMVFDYAEKKFGKTRVARLGTVGLFKSKSALNKVGTNLWIPRWMTDKVGDSVVERSSGDSRAMLTLLDALETSPMGQALLKDYPEAKIAAKLEGHPNNASRHAAGIVITNKPITEYVAVDMRSRTAMCDKKDSESLNLLKIDALGLTQLSVFENAMSRAGLPDKSGWLEKLPLNDKKAFDVLNKGHFAGVFQFTGQALQFLTRRVKVNHIEDIISLTAIGRPGPLATGGADRWIKRRNGEEAISTEHPMLTELTKGTYGVVIYQETVMNIVREMGKMSWEDTSAIRKAMSGRLGDEFFEGYWIKFRKGAMENGVAEDVARSIWKQINTFGSWAFNRSHAVAYGVLSYWSCWLKAYYPVEFAAATLDAESDALKQILVLRELQEEGIDYVPVDAEHSTDRWEIAKRKKKRILVGPLVAIKGIGPATVKEILEFRKKKEPIRPALVKKLQRAETEIDSLYPIRDTINRMHPDMSKINIISSPTPINKVQPGFKGEVMIFAVANRIAPVDENEPQRVLKRGYEIKKGPTDALNLFMRDDTDEIFCKINRYDYKRIGEAVVNKGRPGKSLYAIKGTVPEDFRMISIKNIRYLGDLKTELRVAEEEGDTNDSD